MSESTPDEQRMREMEQELSRLRLLVDRSHGTLVLHDIRGRLLESNRYAHENLGYTREEFLKLEIGDVNPTVGAIPKAQLGESWRKMPLNSSVRVETRHRHKDGHEIPMEMVIAPFMEQGERLFVAVGRNISERARMEEQRREMFARLDELVATRTAALQREVAEHERTERELSKAMEAAEAASLAKSQFLASMSHELRTPLNAVIGYSEMLIEDAEDGGDASLIPDLERIRGAGKHLLGVINDILDLSKVEAGKIELYIEPISLDELIAEVMATIKPLARANDNALSLSVETTVKTITTDVTRLRQVLFNLLSNACKFTDSGRVELRVRELDVEGEAWIRYEIEDTGVGIDAEQLPKLFKPFTQADASTSRRFGGTGLGLSISDQFAKMLGGGIDVRSEREVGSTFSLWLPAVHPVAPTSTGAAVFEPAPREQLGTVLIVDDEAESRALLRRLLENEGYAVLSAPSGARALELAAEHEPDAITLDVMMPGMDGWAVLSRLKQIPALADTPVVLVSMVPDAGMGYALGAADVLSKPVARERLLSVLSRYRLGPGSNHVLVVDDDADARELLCRAVLEAGWHVQEAQNGLIALAAMRAHKPRLVLLDLMMPQIDGFEVLEQLRADPALRAVPVVIVTAKMLSESERRLLSLKAASVLAKGSYSRTDLVEHLRELVSRKLG
ncbi:Sensory/regulatory protein RpfC [Enhygromyxa salina]|uniref:histidine kinase n=1 Tax=Enhygromyxa salina TaxID=215803 RepID=A0A2S9XRB0_9BACT|nr:response regulator [Enhygromyxa salina]PRP95408.1 Sensory/regulatory protein RpfC [Enhygromyxa salina]